ncbi:hypothetical protein KSF_084460 [Reticulibacter mediterranei]|uniref:Uncharacterized protein n=1 Tax=Reticulibacter mediterranei TaxID=2778369 RepID=A0A8J3ITP8_9CHLR|nr:hypothetical protein KSF_084460 [Reticulibacter mediterranei]
MSECKITAEGKVTFTATSNKLQVKRDGLTIVMIEAVNYDGDIDIKFDVRDLPFSIEMVGDTDGMGIVVSVAKQPAITQHIKSGPISLRLTQEEFEVNGVVCPLTSNVTTRQPGTIIQTATATGDGRVFQAGRRIVAHGTGSAGVFQTPGDMIIHDD